jgi:hypothetical protein
MSRPDAAAPTFPNTHALHRKTTGVALLACMAACLGFSGCGYSLPQSQACNPQSGVDNVTWDISWPTPSNSIPGIPYMLTFDGTVGTPFSVTFTIIRFTGSGSLAPAIYADAGTVLPPGLTATNGGGVLTISGTPTTAGTFRTLVSSSNRCRTVIPSLT